MMNTIAIILASILLLSSVVLSCAVLVLQKRVSTLEEALSALQTGAAAKDKQTENLILFILLTLLSTQQGLNIVFSLLSHQDEFVTSKEPPKQEIKLH